MLEEEAKKREALEAPRAGTGSGDRQGRRRVRGRTDGSLSVAAVLSLAWPQERIRELEADLKEKPKVVVEKDVEEPPKEGFHLVEETPAEESPKPVEIEVKQVLPV